MVNKFLTLDCNDDVVSFNKDTFTVGRFQELIHEIFIRKYQNRNIIDIFRQISIGEASFESGNIIWESSIKGIYCKLLKINSKGWQAGKLRTQVYIKFIPARYPETNVVELDIQVELEFCPDEPDELTLPLDDIRQCEEYKMTSKMQ